VQSAVRAVQRGRIGGRRSAVSDRTGPGGSDSRIVQTQRRRSKPDTPRRRDGQQQQHSRRSSETRLCNKEKRKNEEKKNRKETKKTEKGRCSAAAVTHRSHRNGLTASSAATGWRLILLHLSTSLVSTLGPATTKAHWSAVVPLSVHHAAHCNRCLRCRVLVRGTDACSCIHSHK